MHTFLKPSGLSPMKVVQYFIAVVALCTTDAHLHFLIEAAELHSALDQNKNQ